jgi:hypothetical protein
VELSISEVAYDELRTQWREARQSDLEKAKAGLNGLAKAAYLAGTHTKTFQDLRDALSASADLEAWSHEIMADRLGTNLYNRVPIDPLDSSTVLQGYFRGDPPFKTVKSREDFPDAFIAQAALRDAAGAPHGFFAIVADKALRSALVAGHLNAFADLDELFARDELQERMSHLSDAAAWVKLESKLDGEALADELKEWISDNRAALVEGVRPRLQGFGLTETYHLDISFVENIIDGPDLGEIEGYGAGWLSIPAEVILEVSFDFMVYRSDAFDLPSWIDVDTGDFEEDHYFHAYGTVPLRINTDLTVKLDLSHDLDPEYGLIKSVDVANPEGELEL